MILELLLGLLVDTTVHIAGVEPVLKTIDRDALRHELKGVLPTAIACLEAAYDPVKGGKDSSGLVLRSDFFQRPVDVNLAEDVPTSLLRLQAEFWKYKPGPSVADMGQFHENISILLRCVLRHLRLPAELGVVSGLLSQAVGVVQEENAHLRGRLSALEDGNYLRDAFSACNHRLRDRARVLAQRRQVEVGEAELDGVLAQALSMARTRLAMSVGLAGEVDLCELIVDSVDEAVLLYIRRGTPERSEPVVVPPLAGNLEDLESLRFRILARVEAEMPEANPSTVAKEITRRFNLTIDEVEKALASIVGCKVCGAWQKPLWQRCPFHD